MRKFVSKIGGQAVMEGVMMRGEKSVATAVRTEDGRIEVETSRIEEREPWWKRVPVLRGFLNFFMMMIIGSKVLTRSAELYGEDAGEPSKLEMWLAEKSKKSAMDIAIYIGVILGVVFAVGLFIALPLGIVALLEYIPGFRELNYVWRNLVVSGVRLLILFAYLALVSLVPDIKRVFMYHGAEHKVITCFEQGEELTVENARKMSRLHDRCGTSFLVITVFISILASAFLPTFDNIGNRLLSFLARFGTRLALLPIVAGVSYEVLKGLARFDNAFVRILKKPGMWFQLLTTREPDDSMLEVSLLAFKTVMAMDADESIPTVKFNIRKDYRLVRQAMLADLKTTGEADAVADWIFVKVLGVERSALPTLTLIDEDKAEEAKGYARRVKEGEPLQYVLGETDFYGVTLKSDPRALIPRGDTEVLVEQALKDIDILRSDAKEALNVLDICTGSGAIAIALSIKGGIHVTATDISEEALSLARENVESTGANVTLLKSDLFENIEGEFDLITANPPYIPSAEVDKLDDYVKREPRLALDGGADGLDYYRKIRLGVAPRLKAGGVLLLEIGFDQGAAVSALFADMGEITVIPDLEGHDRVVKVIRNV